VCACVCVCVCKCVYSRILYIAYDDDDDYDDDDAEGSDDDDAEGSRGPQRRICGWCCTSRPSEAHLWLVLHVAFLRYIL
jgi:hypothetical protein